MGFLKLIVQVFFVWVGRVEKGGAPRVETQTQKKWRPEGWPEKWGPEGGPKGGSPKGGGPKGGGPKGGGPKGGGPKGGGAQNFALFFPLLPQNSFFSSLSGGLLVEFWWCLKRRGAQMCTFGVLWLSCEAPAARSRRGFTRQHDQTETLKPTPTRETPLRETVKQAPTPNSTHTHTHIHNTPHTTHHTQQVELDLAKVGWPKSVGQSRFGQSRP